MLSVQVCVLTCVYTCEIINYSQNSEHTHHPQKFPCAPLFVLSPSTTPPPPCKHLSIFCYSVFILIF